MADIEQLRQDLDAFNDVVALQERVALHTHLRDARGDMLRGGDEALADAARAQRAFRSALRGVMAFPDREWAQIAARFSAGKDEGGMAFVRERLTGVGGAHARIECAPDASARAVQAAERWRTLARALPRVGDLAEEEEAWREAWEQRQDVTRQLRSHPLREELLARANERTGRFADPLPLALLEHANELAERLDLLSRSDRQALMGRVSPSAMARIHQAIHVTLALQEDMER